jgi:hypothetical protein
MTLHREAVAPDLLALLRRLMADAAFNAFALVGGTSLALRFGHRRSLDLDLFTRHPFDAPSLAEDLKGRYALAEVESAANTVRGVIDGMNVDFIAHRYPLLRPVEEIEGIRMLSVEDVAAMKLNAIANRGGKKDFWDCAELLQHFSRDELLSLYGQKYAADSVWHVEKSLACFDDAEGDPDPRDLRGWSWVEVKGMIGRCNRLGASGVEP